MKAIKLKKCSISQKSEEAVNERRRRRNEESLKPCRRKALLKREVTAEKA